MNGTYSLELVGLSLLVAVAASYVAFALAAHIRTTRGWAGAYWLAGGAVALGTGIWSMHFIGMLAYELPIQMAYDLKTTAVSLVIAIIVSGFALFVVSRRRPSLSTLAVSSVAMGTGIALMHYSGMAAMDIVPAVTYDTALVVASIAVAIAASALALSLAFRLRKVSAANVMQQRLLAALAMGVGICAMHYTGMAAARFAPGTICSTPGVELDQFWLAIAIAIATFIFLGATMLILTIDVRLAHQLDEANARIAALAREDPLTGLANRRTFLEQLETAFRGCSRAKSLFAVLLLDLDGFKDINDTLGHAAGDDLIIEVARRLRKTVRRDDVVARFGGDEFAVLQRNLETPADAATLAAKIGAAIAKMHTIGDDKVAVTASIGIAHVSEKTSSPTDLLVQADLALYRSKDDGRNRFSFHDDALDRLVRTRTVLGRELQSAIDGGELELRYRPQLDIASGSLVGLDARIQWNHLTRGVILPEVFIPIAERSGMIRAVGEWVIDEACRQLRVWQEAGVAPPVVAVDMFGGQLKGTCDIAGSIKARLDLHGIAPETMELEFDEQVLMQALQRQPGTIEELRRQGFRMAIADFGSGYSSIGYLAKAPVQRLKIPPVIVAGAPEKACSERIIRTIVTIAREIGAKVVADGVETDEQAAFLLASGCAQAQGPYFSPLLSGEEAMHFLRAAGARVRARKSSAA